MDVPGLYKFLILTTMLFMVFIPPTVCTSSENIQRLNYGVIFQPKGNFKPISDYWAHTIQLILPAYPENSKHPRPCSQVTGIEIDTCQMLHSAIAQSEAIQNSTREHLENFIRQIHDIMPNITMPNEDSRSKRSLLPFVGEFSKTIFGTATERDIQILLHHIAILNKKTDLLATEVNKDTKSLTSFMSVVDDRISNAASEIQKNHKTIAQIGNTVWKLEYGLMATAQVSGYLARQVHQASLLNTKLATLVEDISNLAQGKMRQTLISPNTIATVLQQVQLELHKHFPEFQISHMNPQYYYKHPLFLSARHKGSIYVTFKIPVTSFTSTFNVYKVLSVPVPVNKTSLHSTHLTDLPDYFAVSKDNQYYSSMTKDQWHSCHGKVTKHCPREIKLIPMLRHSCLSLIFQQVKGLILDHCDFRLSRDTVKPSILTVDNDSILVTNTSHLTLNCKGTWKTVPACHFCILRIPCYCSVQSPNYYLPPTIHNCANQSDSLTKLHPVNLALLQYYFDKDRYTAIQGNTLFPQEVNFKIPPFNLFQNKYKEFVANDKKGHLSLKKIFEATKKNEYVFENSADALINEMSIPQTFDFTMLTTIFTYVSFALSVFLCIALFVTCRKLRTLSIALAALNQGSEAVKLPIYTGYPILTSPTNPMPTSSTPFPNCNPHNLMVALCAVLCMILIATLLWHFKGRKGTKLLVEITNGKQCIKIPVQTLPLCPKYWQFSATEYLANVEVTGYILPSVSFDWKDMKIWNALNEQFVQPVCMVNIDWWSAFRLKKILNQPFSAFLILSHDDHAFHINVHRATQDAENDRPISQTGDFLYPKLPELIA